MPFDPGQRDRDDRMPGRRRSGTRARGSAAPLSPFAETVTVWPARIRAGSAGAAGVADDGPSTTTDPSDRARRVAALPVGPGRQVEGLAAGAAAAGPPAAAGRPPRRAGDPRAVLVELLADGGQRRARLVVDALDEERPLRRVRDDAERHEARRGQDQQRRDQARPQRHGYRRGARSA